MRGQRLSLIAACLFLAALTVPAIISAQIEPTPEGPVDYGPTITTDQGKLFACYSLINRMIDRYNEESARAAFGVNTTELFRAYAYQVVKPRLHEVLAERNRLKEKIRTDTYTEKEWRDVGELPPDEYQVVYWNLYGDVNMEKSKPTLATSAVVDKLETVGFDSLTPMGWLDPIEDFTTYDEEDPGSDIVVTASKIACTQIQPRADTLWVNDDKGAAHFSGDFEHLIKVKYTSWYTAGAGVYFVDWMLQNYADKDLKDLADLGNADALLIYHYYTGSALTTTLREYYGGSTVTDAGANIAGGETHFYTYIRDDDGGATNDGLLTCYQCTVDYWGEPGSVLEATMEIDLHAQNDFQYVYALTGYDTGAAEGNWFTGDIEDLDLQEGAPEQVGYSFGHIIGG